MRPLKHISIHEFMSPQNTDSLIHVKGSTLSYVVCRLQYVLVSTEATPVNVSNRLSETLITTSPKYLTLYSLAILIVVRIGSEQLCSFSRGIFQPICKHFVCVQLFLKLWTNTHIIIHGSYLWAFCSSFHHSRSTASSVDESSRNTETS